MGFHPYSGDFNRDTVTVHTGAQDSSSLLNESARNSLTAMLAEYLSQYPDIRIVFDELPLEIEGLISRTKEFDLDVACDFGAPKLKIIEWNISMDRFLCLCDENGATLHKMKAGIRAPGFEFTAYVRWNGFREHESLLVVEELASGDVESVLTAAREKQHARSCAGIFKRGV